MSTKATTKAATETATDTTTQGPGEEQNTPRDERGLALAWVQFCAPARRDLSGIQSEAMIIADNGTELFLGPGPGGFPTVTVHAEGLTAPASFPITNVAAYGLK